MGSLVDPPEQSSIVHDVPDPVCNLLESDVLVTEGIAEKGLRGVQAESAAVADATAPRAMPAPDRRCLRGVAPHCSAGGRRRTSVAGRAGCSPLDAPSRA